VPDLPSGTATFLFTDVKDLSAPERVYQLGEDESHR